MAEADPTDALYTGLRRLAAGDPRRARDEFLRIVAEEPDRLAGLLELASRAGEGRVRQVAASAARGDPAARAALHGWLTRWHAVEPDEFTKRAIAAVLAADQPARPPAPRAAELPRDFADTYRYVTERVCHQVRNALAPTDTELIRLARVVRTLADPAARAALTDILGGLQAGFDRASRAVEFDRGDGYMSWSGVDLADWLCRAAVGFGGRYGHANFALRPPVASGGRVRVWATPFLLDVVFGNLWSNAVQKLGTGCDLVIELARADRSVEVLVCDSGPGFDDAARAAAFDARYSTNPGNRGRGLLEIAEAVDRLHGRVAIVAVAGAGHRVCIRLPLEGV